MFRTLLVTYISLVFTISLAAAPETPKGALSAAEIVDKNVAARGGLQAWRSVQTISMSGKLGAGGNQRAVLDLPGQKPTKEMLRTRPAEEAQLPFLMEFARPRKMRFELEFNGQTAIQVYDGTNGWKLRPYLGRKVVEPYSDDELKISSNQAELDGPLVDYAAKGTKIELAGMEKVEDRDTYKIKLTLKNGESRHVWIDAQTFLETKIEGQPRRLDGVSHQVEVYMRDYRQVDGLQIPFLLETRVLPVAKTLLGFKDPPVPPEKIVIEKVSVNPKLEQSRFVAPEVPLAASAK